MLLIKFGEKEHLEQLKNGILHFSTLETFQDDPTSFRGDRLDGKLLYDLREPFLVDGRDISPYLKEVTFFPETDCPQLSFSASILSKKVCVKLSNGLYTINESFVEEMKKFGDHFLILNPPEFIRAVTDDFKKAQCEYEYHPMVYMNKRNPKLLREYFRGLDENRREFAHLFIKDTANLYPMQNEWRLVVFDTYNHYCTKSCKQINIETGFSTQMPVLETEGLVSLQCSEEFLI